MQVTLARRALARFSKTARSCPGPREAGGHGPEVRGPHAVRGRRLAHDLAEGPPEAAEAREAHIEADLAHAPVRLSQEEHRPLDPPALEVAVRRLAEGGAKCPNEVRLRDVGD